MKFPIMLGAGMLCLLSNSPATAGDTAYGEIDADLHLRHESVKQDNALEDAQANTLHARLGFTTKSWHDLSFSIQGEVVTSLGTDDYNSGPDANGNTALSAIPDTEDGK